MKSTASICHRFKHTIAARQANKQANSYTLSGSWPGCDSGTRYERHFRLWLNNTSDTSSQTAGWQRILEAPLVVKDGHTGNKAILEDTIIKKARKIT